MLTKKEQLYECGADVRRGRRLSGRNVKNAAEFESGNGTFGASIVTGMIIGSMVGGSCTIATAQVAYSDGLIA